MARYELLKLLPSNRLPPGSHESLSKSAKIVVSIFIGRRVSRLRVQFPNWPGNIASQPFPIVL